MLFKNTIQGQSKIPTSFILNLGNVSIKPNKDSNTPWSPFRPLLRQQQIRSLSVKLSAQSLPCITQFTINDNHFCSSPSWMTMNRGRERKLALPYLSITTGSLWATFQRTGIGTSCSKSSPSTHVRVQERGTLGESMSVQGYVQMDLIPPSIPWKLDVFPCLIHCPPSGRSAGFVNNFLRVSFACLGSRDDA